MKQDSVGVTWKMRLGHVLVCFHYPPGRLFESIPLNAGPFWYVFLHGQNSVINKEAERLTIERNGKLFPFKENRGLARSWNDGISAAMRDNCDAVLILNDDLYFYDHGYERFKEIAEEKMQTSKDMSFITTLGRESGNSSRAGKIVPQDFACVLFPKKLIETIGYFDENFAPAYYEDTDYDRRCSLAGLTSYIIQEVLVEHNRSSSAGLLTDKERHQLHLEVVKNKMYFNRKWGEDNRLFSTPFDEKMSLSIADSDRANPYPDNPR